MEKRSTILAVLIWLFVCYLLLVGTRVGVPSFWILAAAALPLLLWVLRRLPAAIAARLALACTAALLSALGADSLYTGYRIFSATPEIDDPRDRQADVHIWQGEIFPRSYYPTQRNFSRYKPNLVVTAPLFGEAYNVDGPLLLRSPVASRALAEAESEYRIDDHGFRATLPMSQARIFALGDSYTFGDHMLSEAIWHQRLADELGEPIYNLGVSNTSPGQQRMLLEDLFENGGDEFDPTLLLWMIFEANDLEDSYAVDRPQNDRNRSGQLLEEIPLGVILSGIPNSVRRSSVIHGLLFGPLYIGGNGMSRVPPQEIDGIELRTRIYDSEVHGPKIVPYPRYIQNATEPQSYVENHPNRPAFDESLRAVAELSEHHGVAVVVVLAPSFPRIYAGWYEGFPKISARPYFLEYAASKARELGLAVHDLTPSFGSRAHDELLYHRDDSHWNTRGHDVAASSIASALRDSGLLNPSQGKVER